MIFSLTKPLGVDGYDVPSFICTIYFKVPAPCFGGLLALDGISGETIWKHWAPHTVFSVDCASDVTGDFVKDCLATGRGGVFIPLLLLFIYLCCIFNIIFMNFVL